eukprot:TRINITY_DN373_c0_g1_i1.p1 TRINITY_DN373_c0_g1~~TRINITY_DN373_c0_g1_i1.p1  ORF type:complete len:359 (-),score=77.14 TRINITY_DN373_c0_g1_i1:157-1233(-)
MYFDQDNNSTQDFPGGFEGPEKRLLVDFFPPNKTSVDGPFSGLRKISRDDWQDLLDDAKCTIISVTSNSFCDSYVLSESSLFVYPTRVLIKTCGTTVPLFSIPKLLKYASRCSMEVRYVYYSRKNFIFPDLQHKLHQDFEAEYEYLNKYFSGTPYVVGPLTGEHYHVYVADYTQSSSRQSLEDAPAPPRTNVLEVMMHDIDDNVLRQFWKGDDFVSARDVTRSSGIEDLLPGSMIDDFMFTPCGYSMNGLLKQAYWTIHITPEKHCSYVSFEVGISLPSYTELVSSVLQTFKPGKATIAIFTDKSAEVATLKGRTASPALDTKAIVGYKATTKSHLESEGCLDLKVINISRASRECEC